MIYVFDTSSFIVLSHYFPQRFPSFWEQFDEAVSQGAVISVREVYKELDKEASKEHLHDWLKRNKQVFLMPSEEETEFVAEIFAVTHFQYLVTQKQRLKGTPVADPFVIASARIDNACVVTEESMKPNAANIPNVCEHFSIQCTNIEGFMRREGWQF
ncbi:MAG: DUF4411 family protein [Planctomycetes bacterium]|nr:DUF4411 family protein [Planctomycetota bacterium]